MINYIIYELDENYLESKDLFYGEKADRVCYIKTKGLNTFHETEQDALDEIERNGKNFTEYTIVKRIYKTNYENN